MGAGNIHQVSWKTGVEGIMQKKSELQATVEEIELLIKYAVGEEDRVVANALVEKYRNNRVALHVLQDFYGSLPEAREEPLTRVVLIDMRQGLFLLGVNAGVHEYIYLATEEDARCLGEYQEGIEHQEILAFFGYSSKESFARLYPTIAGFEDFDAIRKKESTLCPVCSVAEGENHHLGCSVEVCPWCLGQLSRCNCRFDQLQKEEIESDEDLALFEVLLQEKGRICFEAGQGPSYPAAGNAMRSGKKY